MTHFSARFSDSMTTSCVYRVCPARQGLYLGDSGCIRNASSSTFAICVQMRSSKVRAKYGEYDQGRQRSSHAIATKIQPAEAGIVRPASGESSSCSCSVCSRRSLLPLIGGLLFQGGAPAANAANGDEDQFKSILEEVHPARPDWYEEFFAQNMRDGMRPYEDKMAGYKRSLFGNLDGSAHKILELGVGTGPNLKYYAGRDNTTVVGVDPNLHMEPYARVSADAAGLTGSQFQFIHAVGEAIPVPDSSVDAVVCTLVLCSVKNVDRTLAEVQRVLKPGGTFVFIEHVAATESSLRFWQYLLNPLQQFFADGCNLTRETLDNIQHAGFESVDATRIMVPDLSIIAPHIVGTAQTARLSLCAQLSKGPHGMFNVALTLELLACTIRTQGLI